MAFWAALGVCCSSSDILGSGEFCLSLVYYNPVSSHPGAIVNLRHFIALSLALAAGQAWGQVSIGHVGHDPGVPRNIGAIQQALPNAQVGQIGPDGRVVPAPRPGMLPPGAPQPYPMPMPTAPGQIPGQPDIAKTPPEMEDPNEGRTFPMTAAQEEELRAAEWIMGAASQTMRQSGLSTGRGDQYMLSIASSARVDDRRALSRWKEFLPQFGVDPAKITFESRRLSRQAFDMWASRFVWEACQNGGELAPAGCSELSR